MPSSADLLGAVVPAYPSVRYSPRSSAGAKDPGAVLLAASRVGLATTPLSQALEVPSSREHLQQDVLHVPENPQLLIRVGWPATGAAEPPTTPRRSLAHMLLC